MNACTTTKPDEKLIKLIMRKNVRYFICTNCLRVFQDPECTITLVDLSDFGEEQRTHFKNAFLLEEVRCNKCKIN